MKPGQRCGGLPLRIAQGLAKVGLALKAREWREAFDSGISPTQAQVLSLIRSYGPMRVSDLANALAVTAATVSDASTTLVTKGLLKKERSQADGRALSIGLTAKGRKIAERLSHWPDFLSTAVGALSAEEQQVLLRALIKMIRTLQEQKQIPVAHMCVNCRFFRPSVHDSPESPHHCDFVDAPFGDGDLRIDCPDFEVGHDATWRKWTQPPQPLHEIAMKSQT